MFKHLAWLTTRYPSPEAQEKLAYLQKREMHMQSPTSQAAGWPLGSGSVESANKSLVEARLKGARMRWARHNVNSMLVLRHAVCNREWSTTCKQTVTQRRAARRHLRDEHSRDRLSQACCTLAILAARLQWLSQPPASVSPLARQVLTTIRAPRRPASGYSWHKPVPRSPPSPPAPSATVCAKI